MKRKLEELANKFKIIKLILVVSFIIGLIIVLGFIVRIALAILLSKIFWLLVVAIAVYHLFMKNRKAVNN
jgi:hypothetical protein